MSLTEDQLSLLTHDERAIVARAAALAAHAPESSFVALAKVVERLLTAIRPAAEQREQAFRDLARHSEFDPLFWTDCGEPHCLVCTVFRGKDLSL